MGLVQPGPPTELVLWLRDQFAIKNFIETGTYLGDTAWWAASFFENVVTIEFFDAMLRQTSPRFANQPNVRMIAGDSRTALASIVPSLERPAIFWLDAHWSGVATYGEQDECPLLAEIDAIHRAPIAHFILIDDARFFLAPPPRPHHPAAWPTIDQVIDKLRAGPHACYIVVVEDVIISVPVAAKESLVRYCQSRAR